MCAVKPKLLHLESNSSTYDSAFPRLLIILWQSENCMSHQCECHSFDIDKADTKLFDQTKIDLLFTYNVLGK